SFPPRRPSDLPCCVRAMPALPRLSIPIVTGHEPRSCGKSFADNRDDVLGRIPADPDPAMAVRHLRHCGQIFNPFDIRKDSVISEARNMGAFQEIPPTMQLRLPGAYLDDLRARFGIDHVCQTCTMRGNHDIGDMPR